MKALKWFLVMALILLVAKLVTFYVWSTPAEQGQFLLQWGGYDYRATAVDAVLIFLGALLIAWLAWQLITAPMKAYRARREQSNRLRLAEGLDAYQQGDWARAEKVMQTAAETNPEIVGVSRVSAAQAALAREDYDAADRHIEALRSNHPARAALASADAHLQRGYFEKAIAALDAPEAQPLPARGIALRARAFAGAGRAAEAYGLLGAIRKANAMGGSELKAAESSWAAAAITQATDSNALAAIWDEMPKHLRADYGVVSAYANRAAALGWDEAATRSIEQAMDQQWDDRFVALYASLPVARVNERRARLEKWMSQRPELESTWLALAQLSQQQQDLLAEHDYLQGAVQRSGSSRAYSLLGENLLARGETEMAAKQFANAQRVGRNQAIL